MLCAVNVAQATVYGALIGAGVTVAVFAAGLGSNLWLERRRERREATRHREDAASELATATVDLLTGVQAIRGAYEGRSGWRFRMRIIAIVYAALTAVFAAAGEVSWAALVDWQRAGPLIDRLLTADRDLDEIQRTTALDMATVLGPRVARFYAAVTALTLGGDDKLSAEVQRLVRAVGNVLDAIVARTKHYARAHAAAERALGDFNTAAGNQRRNGRS
jgi:hypothetical protein